MRAFCELAFRAAGIEIDWEGEGSEEKGYCRETGDCFVEVDPRYYRPTEVDMLLGDATKVYTELEWAPRYSLEEMTREMVQSDLKGAQSEVQFTAVES